MSFPEISLSGSAQDLGSAYGLAAKGKIESNVEYYRRLLGWKDRRLEDELDRLSVSLRCCPQVVDIFEFSEALADSASISRDDALMLQVRSELFNQLSVSECTVLADRVNGVLGQTWDWSKHALDNSVVLRVEHNGRHFISFAEAGQLAKVGVNESGIGLALSILRANRSLNGLPIHWLIPQLLLMTNLDEIRNYIEGAAVGRASHIAVMDAEGDALAYEFGPDDNIELAVGSRYAHTNHYLDSSLDYAVDAFPSSRPRLAMANEYFLGAPTNTVADVLSAGQSYEHPIYREFERSDVENFGDVGTIAALIIDPKERSLRVRSRARQCDLEFKI